MQSLSDPMPVVSTIDGGESQTDLSPGQMPYLVFRLDESEYAIPVEHIREIIAKAELSPVPGAPPFLLGVLNLRGRILPVVDLRTRFEFNTERDDTRDCYVILTDTIDGNSVELAVKVDAVCEVARINEEEIDDAPSMHHYAGRLIFGGVAKTPSGVKLIVEANSLIGQLKSDLDGLIE